MPTSTSRNAPLAVTAVLGLAALVFAVLAVVYFVEPASSLPSVVPGHAVGSSHHHIKHGIAVLLLAGVSLAGAWFSTGRRATN